MAEETRSQRCTLCKGEHISLAFCEEYKSMDFVNRCRYAIRTARCIKCLRNHNDCPGHLEYPSVSHCEICQATSHHTLVHSPDLPAISVNGDVINTSTAESDVPPPCLYCEEEHLLPNCNGFQTADYEDRFNFCLRMNVCLVCLRPGRICRSTCAATPETACSICGSVWHHALLHEPDKQRRPKGKTSEAKPRCPRCPGRHRLSECWEFLRMGYTQRARFVQHQQVCPICLRFLNECHTHCHQPGSPQCGICDSPYHHELLHCNRVLFGNRFDPVGLMAKSKFLRCPQCAEGHHLSSCFEFAAMSSLKRKQLCETRFICPKCLKGKELCKDSCTEDERLKCSVCFSRFHHTFLHYALANTEDPSRLSINRKCPQCHEAHQFDACPVILGMTPHQREARRKIFGLCRNCLSNPHQSYCANRTCYHCSSPFHHALLHVYVDEPHYGTNEVSELRRATRQRGVTLEDYKRAGPNASTSRAFPVDKSDVLSPTGEDESKMESGEAWCVINKPTSKEEQSEAAQQFVTRENLETALDEVKKLLLHKNSEEPSLKRAVNDREPVIPLRCSLCLMEKHCLDRCPEFVSAGLQRRIQLLEIHYACSRCLKTGHRVDDCQQNRIGCGFHECGMDHHPLMHRTRYFPHLTYMENVHRSIDKEFYHNPQSCQVCSSKLHLTEACPLWPAARNDRLGEAKHLGLCTICLCPRHEDEGTSCPAEEQVCGVNGCPYSHHPILHPVRIRPQFTENRPKYEDRMEEDTVSSPIENRVFHEVTTDELKYLVNDSFRGTTTLQLERLQVRDVIVFRRFKRGRGQIQLDGMTFCKLYEAYRRYRPSGNADGGEDSSDGDDQDDDEGNDNPPPPANTPAPADDNTAPTTSGTQAPNDAAAGNSGSTRTNEDNPRTNNADSGVVTTPGTETPNLGSKLLGKRRR